MRSQERTIEVQWGWGCECIKIYEQIQSNKNDGIMTEGHLQKLMYILCFSQGKKIISLSYTGRISTLKPMKTTVKKNVSTQISFVKILCIGSPEKERGYSFFFQIYTIQYIISVKNVQIYIQNHKKW